MSANIYEKFEKSFANVSAYALTNKEGEQVGRVSFKYPKGGAGRLWCYVHLFGLEMVRGYADGYGYDKRAAACYSAIKHMIVTDNPTYEEGEHWYKERQAYVDALKEAFKNDGGASEWVDVFRELGYNVLRAI